MLDQFSHIVVHPHFLEIPVFIPIAQNAMAATTHPNQQIGEGHTVVHQLHLFLPDKFQGWVEDDIGFIRQNADNPLLQANLRGGDGPAKTIVSADASDTVE